jgi:hypothetical protein
MSAEELNRDEALAEDLLGPPTPCGDDVLRLAVFRQTAHGLRWRRRQRLIKRLSLPVACFLLGVTITALSPLAEPRVVTVTVSATSRPMATAAAPQRVRSPAEMELEAERNSVPAESARRFREAGDRYLLEMADYRSALRCYRNFLDEADEADLAAAASDTWLLASLKNARNKESFNANADN